MIPDSPAFIADIKKNDQIISIDNNLIYNSSDFIDAVRQKVNKEINIDILRNDKPMSIQITPRLNPDSIKPIGDKA